MAGVSVRRGKILVYRFYDIGSEVDLERAGQLVRQKQNTTRFSLDRPGKSALVIAITPLTVHMGPMEIRFDDRPIRVEVDARLWHFGCLSLCFHIPLPENISWNELVRLAYWLERDDKELDVLAWAQARAFQTEISAAVVAPNYWPTREDYVVYFLQELDGVPEGPAQLFEHADVPALLLAETKEALSEQTKKAIRENFMQYAKSDLAVIDWNSALIVEPSGSMDVPMVIEFANSQLLEMRYYDDLLDERLDKFYKAIAGEKPGILSNTYSRNAKEAGTMYLEIAEVVENVENSLKVVGDFYLATVFRAASARFRFADWQASVDGKLNNLAEVSKLLHSHVSESRNQLMEIIVIVLIALELIPFFRELF